MSPVDSPSRRRLRAALGKGTNALGVWCAIPSPYAAEILADAGADFLVIDRQHGLISSDAMVGMLQAVSRTEVSPLVRVAANEPFLIGQALDAGADGVIVPMIHDAQAAAAAVAACRYPPHGTRSYGPARSAAVVRGTPAEVNAEVLCVLLIESRRAVAAADDICAVPGVDAVMIGMADLAIDFGSSVGARCAELEAAVSLIARAVRRAGIAIVIGATDASMVGESSGLAIVVASDTMLLRNGLRGSIAAERDRSPRLGADRSAQ